MKIILVLIILASKNVFPVDTSSGVFPQFGRALIKKIIRKMTPEEKVKIVVGTGFSLPLT
jgi:hypothetical protein